MPTYDFECRVCKKVLTEVRTIANRNRNMKCEGCNSTMTRIINGPAVHTFTPYTHDNLELNPVRIESRKQEKHEFEKRGLIDAR